MDRRKRSHDGDSRDKKKGRESKEKRDLFFLADLDEAKVMQLLDELSCASESDSSEEDEETDSCQTPVIDLTKIASKLRGKLNNSSEPAGTSLEMDASQNPSLDFTILDVASPTELVMPSPSSAEFPTLQYAAPEAQMLSSDCASTSLEMDTPQNPSLDFTILDVASPTELVMPSPPSAEFPALQSSAPMLQPPRSQTSATEVPIFQSPAPESPMLRSPAPESPRSQSPVIQDRNFTWSNDPPAQRPNFPFTDARGMLKFPEGQEPRDFFNLLFTDDFFELLVRETNAFSDEVFERHCSYESARITNWQDTTVGEMKLFIGLLFHMGVVKYHRCRDYWSGNEKFKTSFFSSRMSRNRWFGILECLHFAPNEVDSADPIYKIRPLVEYFHNTMDGLIVPHRIVCLDESLTPWRGRLKFRQYIPNKKHKYGIKLYVLTEPDGLVHRFLIYAGSADKDVSGAGHGNKVVLLLMDGFLNAGRSLFMDNFYNSVELSATLLDQLTYTTRTLRSNRKKNPSDVVSAKLRKGEIRQRWSSEGINVVKWKDKREVLAISTEFSGDLIECTSRTGPKIKPTSIAEYNKYMGGVDLVDQHISYYSVQRRSVKWYKKLSIHIMEMTLLNAFFLYRRYSVSSNKLSLLEFRLSIIDYLCNQNPIVDGDPKPVGPKVLNAQHFPKDVRVSEAPKKQRKRCRMCRKNKKEVRTYFYCPACPETPGLCLESCFVEYHRAEGFVIISYND